MAIRFVLSGGPAQRSKVICYIFGQQQLIVTGCVRVSFSNHIHMYVHIQLTYHGPIPIPSLKLSHMAKAKYMQGLGILVLAFS